MVKALLRGLKVGFIFIKEEIIEMVIILHGVTAYSDTYTAWRNDYIEEKAMR